MFLFCSGWKEASMKRGDQSGCTRPVTWWLLGSTTGWGLRSSMAEGPRASTSRWTSRCASAPRWRNPTTCSSAKKPSTCTTTRPIPTSPTTESRLGIQPPTNSSTKWQRIICTRRSRTSRWTRNRGVSLSGRSCGGRTSRFRTRGGAWRSSPSRSSTSRVPTWRSTSPSSPRRPRERRITRWSIGKAGASTTRCRWRTPPTCVGVTGRGTQSPRASVTASRASKAISPKPSAQVSTEIITIIDILGFIRMNEWKNGWMNGWMDGWMDGRTDGRTDGLIDLAK